MKREQIKELAAALELGSPLPWRPNLCAENSNVLDANGFSVTWAGRDGEGPMDEEDATLVAKAVSALPRLLAEREKLLEALREYVCFDCGWHADDEVARRYDCSRCRSTANALAFAEKDLTHG